MRPAFGPFRLLLRSGLVDVHSSLFVRLPSCSFCHWRSARFWANPLSGLWKIHNHIIVLHSGVKFQLPDRAFIAEPIGVIPYSRYADLVYLAGDGQMPTITPLTGGDSNVQKVSVLAPCIHREHFVPMLYSMRGDRSSYLTLLLFRPEPKSVEHAVPVPWHGYHGSRVRCLSYAHPGICRAQTSFFALNLLRSVVTRVTASATLCIPCSACVRTAACRLPARLTMMRMNIQTHHNEQINIILHSWTVPGGSVLAILVAVVVPCLPAALGVYAYVYPNAPVW